MEQPQEAIVVTGNQNTLGPVLSNNQIYHEGQKKGYACGQDRSTSMRIGHSSLIQPLRNLHYSAVALNPNCQDPGDAVHDNTGEHGLYEQTVVIETLRPESRQKQGVDKDVSSKNWKKELVPGHAVVVLLVRTDARGFFT
jgi:hypothetical protein